jgi:hypothetical protein
MLAGECITKNELLVQTAPAAVQTTLRTRRVISHDQREKSCRFQNSLKKRPPHFAYNAHSRSGAYIGYPKVAMIGMLRLNTCATKGDIFADQLR